MRLQKESWFLKIFQYPATFGMMIGLALLIRPIAGYLGIQIIALLYLLPVMVCTVLWGLSCGLVAGVAAFLVFNYFFISPYYTFVVHRAQDLITLVVFLVVAVVISQLIGQARGGMQSARLHEWEAAQMYDVISALARLQNNREAAQTLAQSVQYVFGAGKVEVLLEGKSAGDLIVITVSREDDIYPRKPDVVSPMITARGLEGEIRLWRLHAALSKAENRLLAAFAHQGALTIERIRLMQGENRARILEESDRMKSSLLSSVSHELRSPLAAIKAAVSSLRSGTVEWQDPAREELLAMIEEETDQLNILVGNLLDMSRIEAGALQPQKRWNSLAEILRGVVNKMRTQLANYEVVINLPAQLALVPSDYILIGQVFTNLFDNSMKYAPLHSKIAIDVIQEHEQIHVQIVNQGPTVPAEHLERIFDKFYRVTAADRITGTGLGLSICKGIIEAHGGRIWAENGENCFLFHFTLPLLLNGSLPVIPHEGEHE